MNIATRLFNSSLGMKYLMSITGFGLAGFVIAHLIGNLQIFLGKDVINRYGHFLQSNLELIWPARIALLAMVILHIWAAIRLSALNRAARPVSYKKWSPTAASYASRTMLMSGLIVFFFIIYHLLHFTVQVEAINLTGQNFVTFSEPLPDGSTRHDVFRMMVAGFSNPIVSIFYIIAMALLALHLSHGLQAMFFSLGWKKRSYAGLLDGAAKAVAIFIFIGYVSIPIAILFFKYGKEALN
ncbi:MAG: succinate dehydrogenase cytochrome b subunit [Verrucomicrobia bacterium]|nr:succinate dehydrogenase cytochrome b subunit [Verrucomicrobiota bacterium]